MASFTIIISAWWIHVRTRWCYIETQFEKAIVFHYRALQLPYFVFKAISQFFIIILSSMKNSRTSTRQFILGTENEISAKFTCYSIGRALSSFVEAHYFFCYIAFLCDRFYRLFFCRWKATFEASLKEPLCCSSYSLQLLARTVLPSTNTYSD